MNEMPCSRFDECKQAAVTTCNICGGAFCHAHTLRISTEVPDLERSEKKLAGKPISWYAVTMNKGVASYVVVQRYCLDCYEQWLHQQAHAQPKEKAFLERMQQELDHTRQNVRFIHLNGVDELPEYEHIPLTKVLMLQEQLKTIPWPHLLHCYGSAKDTPFHLLGLFSKKKKECEQARYHIYSAIFHQGTIYEASCAIIPLLTQILPQVSKKQQLELLNLLDALALCEFHADQKVRFIEVSPFSVDPDSHYRWFSRGETLHTENTYHDLQWRELAHRLVGDNMPTFLKLLQDAERPVKIKILLLLAGFQELHELLVPAIESLLARSTDILVQASALFSMSALLDVDATLWEHYLTLALSHHDHTHPLLRYAAAFSLAKYKSSAVVPTVADVLIDAMVHPDKLNAFSRKLPYQWLNHVHVEACFALSQLGVPIGSQGIQKALEQKASSWPVLDTLRVAEALLDVVFFGGWIQNRYWSLEIRGKPSIDAFDADEELGGSSYPYGHGQLIEDGVLKRSRIGTLKVECSDYDMYEVERLRTLYEQQGHDALTDAQRQAIQTVIDCKPLWSIESDFLEIYGLPTRRKKLKKFLAEHS